MYPIIYKTHKTIIIINSKCKETLYFHEYIYSVRLHSSTHLLQLFIYNCDKSINSIKQGENEIKFYFSLAMRNTPLFAIINVSIKLAQNIFILSETLLQFTSSVTFSI